MAKQTVEFAFELEQQVTITPSGGNEGKVIGLWIDRDQVKWAYVQYATTTGEVKTGYFRETELTAKN